ncbi:MAG: hypothetical protein QG656_2582, partial [Candidatus Hydrogenedentes bacterium]|nr:hypothetical protein [Candidatus Hydrogenedentota bacterium]
GTAVKQLLPIAVAMLSAGLACVAQENAASFDLTVLPPEHKQTTDPQTGAELLFLSTNPGEDGNLYYEQRSWLADSSLILFILGREDGGLMGYLTATGELVRLTTPNGALGGVTAARNRNAIFGVRDGKIVELTLVIRPSADWAAAPSVVKCTERVICELGPNYRATNCSLTESSDGKYLSVGAGVRAATEPGGYGYVLVIDVETGAVRELRNGPGTDFDGHVMFSLTNPNLLSYKCGQGAYIEVVDIRDGGTIWRHMRHEDVEFCTHYCWWVNDSITFCGGFHLKPFEDFDVKVANIYSGEIRIVGRGNWWPGATASELAACNWWHAAGHESGRWIVADNWHGDIAVFHGRTTRTYWLTKGHRTYGGGRHPEPGWDRRGEQVIFASHQLGNVDVCVATIPKVWQDEWNEQ